MQGFGMGVANKADKIFSGLMLFFILLTPGSSHDRSEPEFDVVLPNLTTKLGSDASFTCVVKHLGEYKVAWIRSEDKAIIALHNHMVTHNHRFSVTHNGHNTWTLHIKNVQQNDSGSYMCQINTDPQRSQSGTLEVVVPADIIDDETSNDVIVPEGHSTTLKCKATGHPQPKVRWIRQDRRPLPLSKDLLSNPTEKVESWEGETLQTRPLQRSDTGSVLCIANNSVPPLVSKRVMVYVHFHPLIKVSNQLVATPAGINVTLECLVEAVPRPVLTWFKKDAHGVNQLILNQMGKVWQETEAVKDYSLKMKLTITNLISPDFGEYNCSVENSLGGDSAVIKLQELRPPPTTRTTTTAIPDWRKHGKHASDRDRDANGNTIKHSKDKRKQGRNKSEHYHRDYESQEGEVEHLTTSSSLSSLNAIAVGVGGASSSSGSSGSGLSKRNQKEVSNTNTRLHNSEFPDGGASSSSASSCNHSEDKIKSLIFNSNLGRFLINIISNCCLPLSPFIPFAPHLFTTFFIPRIVYYWAWNYDPVMMR